MKKLSLLALAFLLSLALLIGCGTQSGGGATTTTAAAAAETTAAAEATTAAAEAATTAAAEATTTAAAAETTAAATEATTAAATEAEATTTVETAAETPAGATSLAAAEEGAKLRISWWGTQVRHDRTALVCSMFTEQTGIPVDIEFTDWDSYWDKMATQAAAKSLADVMQMSTAYANQYFDGGLVLNLQPYVDEGVLDMSAYNESILSRGRFGPNKELAFLPSGINTGAMWYNADLAAEAGLELKPVYTWDELYEWTKIVKEKTGKRGNLFLNQDDQFRVVGGNLFTQDENGELGVDKDQLVYILNWIRKGLDEDLMVTAAEDAERGSEVENNFFTTGDIWCSYGPSNSSAATIEYAEFTMKMMPGPILPDKNPSPFEVNPTMFWNVTTCGVAPNAAVQLLDFIVNDIGAAKILLCDRGMSASEVIREAIKDDLGLADILNAEAIQAVTDNNLIGEWSGYLAPEYYGEVQSLWQDCYEKVYWDAATPEQAAEAFINDATTLIARAKAGG